MNLLLLVEVGPAVAAAGQLSEIGIGATVANARFVKPLDRELILGLAGWCRLVVTVEEAYLSGGFGSAVMELLEMQGVQDRVPVLRMGIPDEIVVHGDPRQLLSGYGLDADGIAARIATALKAHENEAGDRRLRAVK